LKKNFSHLRQKNSSDFIYSGELIHQYFEVKNEQLSKEELYYLKKVINLCKNEKINLHFLVAPRLNYDQVNLKKIPIYAYPKEFYQDGMKIAGLTNYDLFRGKSFKELKKLFYDQAHMNSNGSKFFSQAIAHILKGKL
jgi:hypothetical protein